MTRERSASCWFLTQERVLYVATKKQRAARAMHACAAATTARAPPSFKHRPRIAVCKGPRRAALLDTTRAFLAPRTHRYGQYFLIPPSLPPSLPLSLSLSLPLSRIATTITATHTQGQSQHTHTKSCFTWNRTLLRSVTGPPASTSICSFGVWVQVGPRRALECRRESRRARRRHRPR